MEANFLKNSQLLEMTSEMSCDSDVLNHSNRFLSVIMTKNNLLVYTSH